MTGRAGNWALRATGTGGVWTFRLDGFTGLRRDAGAFDRFRTLVARGLG